MQLSEWKQLWQMNLPHDLRKTLIGSIPTDAQETGPVVDTLIEIMNDPVMHGSVGHIAAAQLVTICFGKQTTSHTYRAFANDIDLLGRVIMTLIKHRTCFDDESGQTTHKVRMGLKALLRMHRKGPDPNGLPQSTSDALKRALTIFKDDIARCAYLYDIVDAIETASEGTILVLEDLVSRSSEQSIKSIAYDEPVWTRSSEYKTDGSQLRAVARHILFLWAKLEYTEKQLQLELPINLS
jgi:hypothetical protein